MSGRGILTKENIIWNKRILKLVNGRWQTCWEPVSPDRSFAGASLAPAFAAEYIKYTENSIGLIPASDGGSAISEWQKGEALYEHAIFLAKMAMKISNLKAILWHQGEADCNSERLVHYKERFNKMADDLKADLGLPDIKIYIGGLGDYLLDNTLDPNYVNVPQMNKILREIADERRDTVFVSAEGLTPKDDILHFNTESLREFGRRYFEAYAKDNPEFVKGKAADEKEEESLEKQLEAMKQKKQNGEISDEEYDKFIKAYIAKL